MKCTGLHKMDRKVTASVSTPIRTNTTNQGATSSPSDNSVDSEALADRSYSPTSIGRYNKESNQLSYKRNRTSSQASRNIRQQTDAPQDVASKVSSPTESKKSIVSPSKDNKSNDSTAAVKSCNGSANSELKEDDTNPKSIAATNIKTPTPKASSDGKLSGRTSDPDDDTTGDIVEDYIEEVEESRGILLREADRGFTEGDYMDFSEDVAALIEVFGNPNVKVYVETIDAVALHSLNFLERVLSKARQIASSQNGNRIEAEHILDALKGNQRQYSRSKAAIANYRQLQRMLTAYDDSKYVSKANCT